MPKSEQIDRVVIGDEPVECDVSRITERNHQFPEFGHIVQRSAHPRFSLEQRELFFDRLP